MEMQVTIKTKLKISNSEIAWSFSKTMEQYRQACNYVSEYIFNNDFDMKQSRLNKELYTKLRNLFSLKGSLSKRTDAKILIIIFKLLDESLIVFFVLSREENYIIL